MPSLSFSSYFNSMLVWFSSDFENQLNDDRLNKIGKNHHHHPHQYHHNYNIIMRIRGLCISVSKKKSAEKVHKSRQKNSRQIIKIRRIWCQCGIFVQNIVCFNVFIDNFLQWLNINKGNDCKQYNLDTFRIFRQSLCGKFKIICGFLY